MKNLALVCLVLMSTACTASGAKSTVSAVPGEQALGDRRSAGITAILNPVHYPVSLTISCDQIVWSDSEFTPAGVNIGYTPASGACTAINPDGTSNAFGQADSDGLAYQLLGAVHNRTDGASTLMAALQCADQYSCIATISALR